MISHIGHAVSEFLMFTLMLFVAIGMLGLYALALLYYFGLVVLQ